MELRLLLAMRHHGLPEPEKQFQIIDNMRRMITISDFAFPEQRILIYVDSMAFNSSLRNRVHDATQTNQLQNMGYRVLRFIGPQLTASADNCITQIRTALEVERS